MLFGYKKTLPFLLAIALMGFFPITSWSQGGLQSATDSVIVNTVGGSGIWGRGIKFKPTSDMWVMKIGKRVPSAGDYSWVIWDVATQTKVFGQTSLVDNPTVYVYEDCDSIVKLQSGRDYILELYGNNASYYFGYGVSQIGNDMIYEDMYYCNNCNENVYPTSVLQNDYYGTPDFLYSLHPPYANNAGITDLVAPAVDGQFCSGTQAVKIKINNSGGDDLDSVKVDWLFNGVAQTEQSLYFSPALGSGEDTVITIGSADFEYQISDTIKAWTSMPNGIIDSVNSDDTLFISVAAQKQGITVQITPGNPKICAHTDSVVLDAGNPGQSFLWSDASQGQTLTVSSPGIYWVVVESSTSGCSASDTVQVSTLPEPSATNIAANSTSIRTFDFSVNGASNVTSYNWDFGDGSTDTVESPSHTYAGDGNYSVSLIISNRCGSDTLTKELSIHQEGINEIRLGEDQLSLFPNPATNQVTLKNYSDFNMKTIVVYNLLGQKVLETNTNNAKVYQLNTSSYASGIYNVRIIFDNGNWISRKFEIRK